MCGIGGRVGGFDPGLAARMSDRISHRGPDGSGSFEDREKGVMLVHTRLAILDLSDLAKQPMTSPDGRFVLVFNGEIYNYKDLRGNMEDRGEQFKSSGDTEVLLRGLSLDGEGFLSRVNGIFA